MSENYDKESYLKHLSEEVYSIRYQERSTGKVFEVNPCIDDVYFDNMYRNLHT